jgi:hypothetical protein
MPDGLRGLARVGFIGLRVCRLRLARRSTRAEGDSWLTLVTASSAVTWGGLPGYCIVAPLARYALLIVAMRRIPYEHVYVDEPAWARPLGIAQMLLFTAALAPFGAAGTRLVVRLATPIVAAFQLLGTVLIYRRSQRVLGI